MRRPLVLLIALLVSAGLAACGDDADDDGSSTPGTTATDVADPTDVADATDDEAATDAEPEPESDAGPAGELLDQFGVRYCEVLTLTVADAGTTAEVWGTQGLNDCPQDAFAAIDPAAVVADLGVTIALPNGPRHWVLDDIVANELAGSGERHDFGGIEMRSIATIDLGVGVPDRTSYTETSVQRDTEFGFDAEREIYELSAPDGSVYVMQSYSLEIDPTLGVDALAGLGHRLQLPEGWTFAARTLAEPLVVEDVDGVAVIVQDDLRNSYQLRTRG